MTESRFVRMSEVLSSLSYILDTVEGQPQGHAIRSCFIGMRVAERLGLSNERRSALFYALLLKDAGCSSNAARVASMFGADDFVPKRNFKTVDWSSRPRAAIYAARNVSPDGAIWSKARRFVALGLRGRASTKQLVQIRCERGAGIARMLGFSEETARAIRGLDEHWDGAGYPDGLRGEDIPLLARIVGFAQTVEVFYSAFGPAQAEAMIRNRRKRWFDPTIADIFIADALNGQIWPALGRPGLRQMVMNMEPEDLWLHATPERLDQIAAAFANIIDAKSPYTSQHSIGVAAAMGALSNHLGYGPAEQRLHIRAALLHDIGKLGVSNRVLDKPGALTAQEFAEIRKHPELTFETLRRVTPFAPLALVAASHHERLDGSGYHRGVTGAELGPAARMLAVADMYDAMSADRPYRAGMQVEQVLSILRAESGERLCPRCVDAMSSLVLSGALGDRPLSLLSPELRASAPALDWAAIPA